MLKIVTNNRPRVPFALHDLPLKVQQNFDYVREQGDYCERFVKYRGVWYDVFDTMAVCTPQGGSPIEFDGWDSYISETFFSGVLFKWVDGNDSVIVGSYYS